MKGAVGMKCEEGKDRGEAGGGRKKYEVGWKLGKGERWRRKTSDGDEEIGRKGGSRGGGDG